ncbi:MAG: glutamine-hydrolyzing carbamoyl-phosphate synthase small subunit [Halobacteria archaeon]
MTENRDMEAVLALEDGTVVEGEGHGVPGEVEGELVFTTQYTGYEESLTDPSYKFQMLMFTYPLIGNYGVNPDNFQSPEIQAEACIAREFSTTPDDVLEWFEEEEIPAMSGVDSRELTIKTREHGTMRAGLVVGEEASADRALEIAEECPDIKELDLGERVTCDRPHVLEGFSNGSYDENPTVVLIDCGSKRNIITSLRNRNVDVVRMPYDSSPEEIREYEPDSLFVSNGPGDPANYEEAVEAIREFTGEIPISGVCLGHQLISRAFDAETYKLKFGHRGANQPVKDLEDEIVHITAQNHGFAVDEDTLDDLEITEVNANDGTSEALENYELKITARQYHPEAHSGPRDTEQEYFDQVYDNTVEGL